MSGRWAFVEPTLNGTVISFEIQEEETTITITDGAIKLVATIPTEDFHLLCKADAIEREA
jgi:hypothetical protein